ncbi:MAG: M1 family metallopeptidase [Paenibacillus sp.]|uniref:M1 family metallopeptidase n=1 Tax=Paenibacillus sp. TaxID=58172 RepID=UPI0025D59E51|nr:M1 family metallopeptidase [Paenibacillus sp.]MBR2566883.1 M1 family metallopeptidase [Paenibacillus sp.]
MIPRRAKSWLTASLALCLLAGGIWITLGYNRSTSSELPILAPESGKPQARAGISATPESVQSPTAEVYSNRVVEYHMDVKLTDGNKLTGTQTITWVHPGKKTVNELYFHMYPNAFSSPDTTFMKESGGKLRGDVMPTDGYGSMRFMDMQTEDGLSLLHRMQYVQPDDGNIQDKTLIKVRLPKPVKGGESITIRTKFEVSLPKIFARMGKTDNFVMAGQWFPKLSAYEPVGRRGRTIEGWNLHQYHGNSEFYADFGIYSVRIRVPETYKVAATGFPTQQAIVKNGEKVYQFYADDVHDFAWAASPDFVYTEEPFSAPNVPGVRIKLYLDPAHQDLKERYLFAAKAALTNYSEWFGTYPYTTLSIVVPPIAANGAGGMEYPTLITAFGADDTTPGYDLERTVVHEIGHQYFYGMVASNEFEEAWLDEGFTSYAEDKLMEQEYGLIPNLPVQSGLITSPAPLTQPSWKFDSQNQYASNVYTRGKLVLLGIEQQVGTKNMERILSTYVKKYRFKHPGTGDFQKVVEQVTRTSWAEYFNQYVYRSGMADFTIEKIKVTPMKKDGKVMYESSVTVAKKGSDFPKVPVRIAFEDGHTVNKQWNGLEDRITYKLTYTSPVSWAMTDPLYDIVLENRHMNNFLRTGLDEQVKSRWNMSATKLIEAIFGGLSW